MIPKNKKIAILHPYLNKRWWASNMMIYLSNFLSKDNNVTFYTFSHDEKLFPLKDNNFKIKSFSKTKLVSFIKISLIIRNSDYIIIWNSPMHFVWVMSKIFFRSKAFLIWRHHHYPWYYSKSTNKFISLKKFLEKKIIWKIDSVIVNSKYLQQTIKDIYNIDSKILYPVLDNKFLIYNVGNKSVISSNNTIFTYGRRVEGKNLWLIFDTYQQLKNKVSNLILNIWWEWDQLEYYKNKYEWDKNINFLWMINKDQIIKNLENSGIFLFPSKIDSLWLVILESMSIWVPVVSYNLYWAIEIIQNWYNWFLVNSDEEFIEKTYEILNDLQLRKNLSVGAKKTSGWFSEDTFKKQLSQIL